MTIPKMLDKSSNMKVQHLSIFMIHSYVMLPGRTMKEALPTMLSENLDLGVRSSYGYLGTTGGSGCCMS